MEWLSSDREISLASGLEYSSPSTSKDNVWAICYAFTSNTCCIFFKFFLWSLSSLVYFPFNMVKFKKHGLWSQTALNLDSSFTID